LTAHLGHCREFMLFDVNRDERSIKKVTRETPPPHEPGVLPEWLASRGTRLVIAGGMGQRAQQLLEQHGIEVRLGVAEAPAMSIVKAYLEGRLETGSNLCDH
jgi:ATP-binding protein involved in chromosome partitioning